MNNTKKSLEQQLAASEKKSADIRKKIEATKPKNIMERVKSFKDVLKIAKPTKEELALIKYSGKSPLLLFAQHMAMLSLIAQVLNEGHVFSMKSDEERWYPYFAVSSGFVFSHSLYDVAYADSGSASRLSLKSEELAEYAGTIFLQYYKNAIM